MKAIVQDRYGGPEVLELRDIDQPVPKDNEVVVRVHAAGLDQGVQHVMTGLPYLIRLLVPTLGLRKPKVPVRGMDAAGHVEAVGEDVTRFQPGDEVFGWCDGSYAQYACAPEDHFAPKPSNLSFEQAAVVPISSFAALQALRDEGEVQPGQRVLVIGAAGGVGSFAVQLAKAFGAQVTGVCRTNCAELVRSIGADQVIDYTREDFADGRHHYDLILDIGGNSRLSRLRRALTPTGTLVIAGGEGGKWTGVGRQLRALALSPLARQRLTMYISAHRQADLQELCQHIEAGHLTPIVGKTYPLLDVPEAIRHLEDGRAHGKIAITV